MDGLTLEAVLKQDHHAGPLYIGTFAADTLPRSVTRVPALLIVNSDPVSKGGQHWLAISINTEGKGEYFDSYGLKPFVPKHRQFLDRVCKSWRFNHTDLQALDSSVCGQYCVMYLLFKAHGYTLKNFLDIFSTDCQKNDAFVHHLFQRYSKNVKLCDDVAVKKTQHCCKRRK